MSPEPRSALESADFRTLTAARFLLAFARRMQTLVMAWQVYALTHDPLALGLIGLVEAVPALALALWAGDVVDRGEPLSIYRGVIVGSLISVGLLLAAGLPGAGLSEARHLALIYAAAFIAGAARGFSQPALYALVPRLVPRTALARSSAWITTAFQTASVIGPGLGGVLFAWKGAQVPYGLGAALLLCSLLMTAAIRPPAAPAPEPAAPGPAESAWRRMTSGLRFVFADEVLLPALALDMFAVLFGGVEAILPIFAADILHVGASGLGLLMAAPSLGALLGSALMIRRTPNRGAGKLLLTVVTGFGLCVIAFALSRDVRLSAALLALAGALDSVSMVIRGAIVQLASPPGMRGRVAAVNSIFIGTSNELGAFESGAAAKLLGTVPSVVCGGLLTLVTVAAAALWSPRLRAMDLDGLRS